VIRRGARDVDSTEKDAYGIKAADDTIVQYVGVRLSVLMGLLRNPASRTIRSATCVCAQKDTHMPLVRLDLIEGRNEAEIASLLDASHIALVSAFGIPERDRYQVVHEHRRANIIFQDTGLAIPRTDRVVLVSITTRPRSEASKLAFFDELCRLLKVHCGIESSDVIVSIVTNADEDWSFGYGRAQFKTGEL
jgi:hypothetical protein